MKKRVIIGALMVMIMFSPSMSLADEENGLIFNEDASFDAPTANQDKYEKEKDLLKDENNIDKVLKHQQELREKGIWEKTSPDKNTKNGKYSPSGKKTKPTPGNPMGLTPPYKPEYKNLYERSRQLAREGRGCSAVDGYTSCIGNCTWYVESRIKQLTGVKIGKWGPWGNGGQWKAKAQVLAKKYPGQFKITTKPKFGHILSVPGNGYIRGVSMAQYGGWGHVMFVERVNPDGSIVITEGNWYACRAGDQKQHGGVQDYNPYDPSKNCVLMGSATTISASDAKGRQYIEIKEVQDILEGKNKKQK